MEKKVSAPSPHPIVNRKSEIDTHLIENGISANCLIFSDNVRFFVFFAIEQFFWVNNLHFLSIIFFWKKAKKLEESN